MFGLEFTLFDRMNEVMVTAEVPRVGFGGGHKYFKMADEQGTQVCTIRINHIVLVLRTHTRTHTLAANVCEGSFFYLFFFPPFFNAFLQMTLSRARR